MKKKEIFESKQLKVWNVHLDKGIMQGNRVYLQPTEACLLLQ